MTDRNLDDLLRRELLGPDTAPDEAFVARVRIAITTEEQLAARRTAAWLRFVAEAAGSAAVATAFVLMGRLSPASGEVDLLTFAPATGAALVLSVWLWIGMRPAGSGHGPSSRMR